MIALSWVHKVLVVGPWVLAGGAIVTTAVQTARLANCRTSIAVEANKAQAKVAAAKEADAKFTRALEEQLRPITDAIRDQSHATAIALSKVRSDPNCAAPPAARAFDGGVRPGGQPAGPGR